MTAPSVARPPGPHEEFPGLARSVRGSEATLESAGTNGNVPAELSSFIGRELELAQLAKVQPSTRLLTLVGPGGVGKSRLALRLALVLRNAYPDGVWRVELSALSDPIMLEQTVASALGVREQRGQSCLQALVHALQPRTVLLILDNCEHLVAACSELAVALLRASPRLHILATSREPLEAEGDTIWRVPPLSLPAAQASELAAIESSEAVQLFATRARAREPRFGLTQRNCAHIAAICRQLDGLPLALELAAARVGSMGEADIAARLRLGLALQLPGQSTAPRRQQTLRATLAWSHDLLSEPERILFRRLAVFVGGWTLEAAEAICSDAALPAQTIAARLDRLVARSLVMLQRHAGAVSYRLLQTVRSYALEELEGASEREALHHRHLSYLLSLAERDSPEAMNAAHARLLNQEQENMRAALAWAVHAQEVELGLRLAIAACSFWYFRGHYAEGREWLERLLELPNGSNSITRGRAEAWLGQLLLVQSGYGRAEEWIRRALERQRSLDDKPGAALSVAMLGHLSLMRGDLERARGLCAEGAEGLRALGSPAEVSSLLQCGVIAVELGDLEGAHRVAAECQAEGRALQASQGAWLLFLRGRIAETDGDAALAEGLLSEALRLQRTLPEQQAVIVVLIELGHVLLDRHKLGQAPQNFAEAIELAHTSGERMLLARALEGLARSVVSMQTGTAVRLAGAADGLRTALGCTAWPSDRRRLAAWLPIARRSLKASVYRTAWEAGRVASADQAVALVRGLRSTPTNVARSRPDPLTRREREVVVLLARALSNQEIAAELTISPATARTHVDHVLAKLGLHSRAQVAVWASQRWLSGVRSPMVQPASARRRQA